MASVKDFVRRISVRKPKPKDGKNTAAKTFASFQQQQQQQPRTNELSASSPSADVQDGTIIRPTPTFYIPPPPPEDVYTPEPRNGQIPGHQINAPGGDWVFENILLTRQGRTSLGFMIAGGLDDDTGDTFQQYFYVTKIIPGGIAANDQRLRLNDVIVSVNGTPFQNLTHREAVDFLNICGDSVRLVIKRLVCVETIIEMDLVKSGRGLGFTVAGGIDDQIIEGDNGIFITKIVEGGSAERDGRLAVGDRLIAVNDVNLCGVTHDLAVSTLKATQDCVHLVIGKLVAELPPNMKPAVRQPSPASARAALNYTHYELPPLLTCQNEPDNNPSSRRVNNSKESQLPQLVPRVMTVNDVASFVKEPRNIVLKRKRNEGLGFNIVGGKDGYGVFVSSLVPGGLADASGQLRRGDQLLKVNGADLQNASHEEAVAALKAAGNTVKIVVQYRPQEFALFERKVRELLLQVPANESGTRVTPLALKTFFIRALFDFDPSKEVAIPGEGLAFSFGDILHVVRAADGGDDNWWQARRVVPWSDSNSAGLIPSKARIESRKSDRLKNIVSAINNDTEVKEVLGAERKRRSFSLSKKMILKAKDKSTNGVPDNEFVNETGCAMSYEPVVQLQARYTRPVVIIGPLKDRVYDEIVTDFPDKFSGCIPHTSRPMRPGEVDGRDYHFVESRDRMEQDVRRSGSQYIEVGVYNEHLYGLTAQSIKQVALQGKHCIIDVTSAAIMRLHAADLYPIAILVKPATPATLTTWEKPLSEEDSKKVYLSTIQQLHEYGKYFTAVVTAETETQACAKIKQVIQEQSQSIIWVASGESL